MNCPHGVEISGCRVCIPQGVPIGPGLPQTNAHFVNEPSVLQRDAGKKNPAGGNSGSQGKGVSKRIRSQVAAFSVTKRAASNAAERAYKQTSIKDAEQESKRAVLPYESDGDGYVQFPGIGRLYCQGKKPDLAGAIADAELPVPNVTRSRSSTSSLHPAAPQHAAVNVTRSRSSTPPALAPLPQTPVPLAVPVPTATTTADEAADESARIKPRAISAPSREVNASPLPPSLPGATSMASSSGRLTHRTFSPSPGPATDPSAGRSVGHRYDTITLRFSELLSATNRLRSRYTAIPSDRTDGFYESLVVRCVGLAPPPGNLLSATNRLRPRYTAIPSDRTDSFYESLVVRCVGLVH